MDDVIGRWASGDASPGEELSRHFTEVVRNKMDSRPLSLEDVQALRPPFRQGIIARHLQRLSEREASARLQIPEATVRARLASGYEMLRCDAKADFSRARAEYGSAREG